MFIPFRKTGKLFTTSKKNVYGDREFNAKSIPFGWAPVYLRSNLSDSSVRADSSASRGRAQERVSDNRIIIEKNVTPKKGDKITLDDGDDLTIDRIQERMDINGRLHHWEVDCGSA